MNRQLLKIELRRLRPAALQLILVASPMTWLCVLVGVRLVASLCAQELDEKLANAKLENLHGLAKGTEMDYGRFLSYTINGKARTAKDADNLALKGIAIKVGRNQEATVCFDTDLMRYAAGWTGGFLDIATTHLSSYKGTTEAFAEGTIQFSAPVQPGWIAESVFHDPRPLHNGPLPADQAKFRGLYRNGDQVVLAYTVGKAEVFELPGYKFTNDFHAFTRTIQIAPTDRALKLLICDWNSDPKNSLDRDAVTFTGNNTTIDYVIRQGAGPVLAVGIIRKPRTATLEATDGHLELQLPALPNGSTFKLLIMTGPRAGEWKSAARSLLEEPHPLVNPKNLCRGGPAQWTEPVITRGKLGFGSGPYVVDTLTVPEINPWKSWLRFAAFDFFSDGRAAISTWNGDVWIVSGIDDKLEKLTWRRFASGLYDALGLKVVDDKVYVLGRDQITRLQDLNNDGEADYYENFNNDGFVAPNYHAFAMDLDTDKAGNFYYARTGHRADSDLPQNGCLLKVSPDGSKTEVIATGFRVANGLSIGPQDEITCSDNQGNWVPSSRINLVRPGGFYGYVPQAKMETVPTHYEPPICWLPMTLDNSSGGQVWVTSDKWGPFKGHLLHTSYGRSALFHVMVEQVEGQVQGGVMQFPLRFDSGIMRARFHPRDGQLYVSGLKGWQTSGARDGAFQRVRYTGKPVRLPRELHAKRNGIEIAFTDALDATSAEDEQSYAIEQWNYKWTEKYGSPDFSVANPERQGRDAVPIKSVKLSADGKSVFLEIPDLKPVMQMRIQFRIKAADGALISSEIHNTINRITPL